MCIRDSLKDEEEEKYTQIVLHEFIHAKRRDNLWKFLALFLLCAYWQHPYLWFFYFTFLREVELSCDEEVLRRIGEDGRADVYKRQTYISMVLLMVNGG